MILLVSFNLRTPMTSVGPVMDLIQTEYGMSAGMAGLITTLPLIMFGVASPFVPAVNRRLGYSRTMCIAIASIIAGELLRNLMGLTGLFAGTALIGIGIGIGNVLLPGYVRSRSPEKAGVLTGLYTAGMCAFSAVGAGLCIPLSDGMGLGWRGALTVWVSVAVLALIVWAPGALKGGDAPAGRTRGSVSVWRCGTAWWVTLFMGTQSLVFYTLVTWLPTMVMAKGFDASFAGNMALIYQVVAIPTSLLIPVACSRVRDQRGIILLICAWYISGFGMFLASDSSAAIISASALMALAMGGGIGASLALISLRSPGPARTDELSGMAQSAGFLIAAVGPVLIGAIHDASGDWSAPVFALLAATAVFGVFGWFASRDVTLPE